MRPISSSVRATAGMCAMTRRKTLAICIIAMTFAPVAAMAQSPRLDVDELIPDIFDGPLSISASEFGDFSRGHSWTLDVDESGKATLTISTSPKAIKREFKISKSQLKDLRKALANERFFELRHYYGELVPDSSETTITIAAGKTRNTVTLRFLMNWVHYDVAKLEEPARAIRVLNVIRGWFDDAEAVDLRKYDRMVLDAVDRRKSGK
jgi:hypothetical protein